MKTTAGPGPHPTYPTWPANPMTYSHSPLEGGWTPNLSALLRPPFFIPPTPAPAPLSLSPASCPSPLFLAPSALVRVVFVVEMEERRGFLDVANLLWERVLDGRMEDTIIL